MTDQNDPVSGLQPVNLARESDFSLGALAVSPSSREVARGDWREALEPRVMQVLVALYQADGAVVSRDDLIARCWEGRVVGEDAINRAIGRLRRLSESDGGASFEIETIPRVGYRLKTGAAAASPAPPAAASTASRRWLLAGGSAALLAGGGYLAWRRSRPAPPTNPTVSRIALQIEQGRQAIRAGNPEAAAQAQGIFEHLVEIAPGTAEAWGGLAPTLMPLLKQEIGALFLPWSVANAAAITGNAKTFEVSIGGTTWSQEPQKYHARSLTEICRKYTAARRAPGLDAILRDSGCLGPLAQA